MCYPGLYNTNTVLCYDTTNNAHTLLLSITAESYPIENYLSDNSYQNYRQQDDLHVSGDHTSFRCAFRVQ
jgi:hypothetical protein